MDNIQELAKAFVKAQAEIENAVKDRTNPHFRSKYADLGNVVDAIKPALAKHGLGFIQVSKDDAETYVKVETIIVHESGQTFSCGCVAVPVNKNDAQGYGSAMTYARRYSLQSAFGVAPEDDDGNGATAAKPEPRSEARPVKSSRMPESEIADWKAAIDEAALDSLEELRAKTKAAVDAAKKAGDVAAMNEFRSYGTVKSQKFEGAMA